MQRSNDDGEIPSRPFKNFSTIVQTAKYFQSNSYIFMDRIIVWAQKSDPNAHRALRALTRLADSI